MKEYYTTTGDKIMSDMYFRKQEYYYLQKTDILMYSRLYLLRLRKKKNRNQIRCTTHQRHSVPQMGITDQNLSELLTDPPCFALTGELKAIFFRIGEKIIIPI